MKPGVLSRRLANQSLARATFSDPDEVVAWFGAVQAQDYLGALWALGQRCIDAAETEVEAAEARRAIVRTWPMRGTLHFVAAADARWITQLLAPRVIARNAPRWKREFDVDLRTIDRARRTVCRVLEGGKRRTRAELYEALEARRIRTGNSRGLHILLWLSMDGTLCLAGRAGKQHTFALLDEWLAPTPALERDAALACLASRYFSSHGPATLTDFAWWSGLTLSDARVAIDGAAKELGRTTAGDSEYWHSVASPRRTTHSPHVRLLPAYDEYTVAYKDRSLLAAAPGVKESAAFGLLSPVVVVDGRVAGRWTRELRRDRVLVRAQLSTTLDAEARNALLVQVHRYGRFLGRDAVLSISS